MENEYNGHACGKMNAVYLARHWGKGLDIRFADLRGADLRGADLRGADLRGANLTKANLTKANLRGANLWEANLRDADLRDANLDYSCLPLWCGGQDAKVDVRLARQFLAHALSFDCDDEQYQGIREFARAFCECSHIAQFINEFAKPEREQERD